MRSLSFTRDGWTLYVQRLYGKRVSIAYTDPAEPTVIQSLGFLQTDEKAEKLQEILSIFLTGQSVDKALRGS